MDTRSEDTLLVGQIASTLLEICTKNPTITQWSLQRCKVVPVLRNVIDKQNALKAEEQKGEVFIKSRGSVITLLVIYHYPSYRLT